MINPHKTLPVGTEVKVKDSGHTSKVKRILGKWHELEEKCPLSGPNAFGYWELEDLTNTNKIAASYASLHNSLQKEEGNK